MNFSICFYVEVPVMAVMRCLNVVSPVSTLTVLLHSDSDMHLEFLAYPQLYDTNIFHEL